MNCSIWAANPAGAAISRSMSAKKDFMGVALRVCSASHWRYAVAAADRSGRGDDLGALIRMQLTDRRLDPARTLAQLS